MLGWHIFIGKKSLKEMGKISKGVPSTFPRERTRSRTDQRDLTSDELLSCPNVLWGRVEVGG